MYTKMEHPGISGRYVGQPPSGLLLGISTGTRSGVLDTETTECTVSPTKRYIPFRSVRH